MGEILIKLGLLLGAFALPQSLLHAAGPALDCDDCHGKNGISEHGEVPTIAGLSRYYFEQSMAAYRADARACPPTPYRSGDLNRPKRGMCEIAKKYNEKQSAQMAASYASKPFKAAQQVTDPAMVARGAKIHQADCERCHTKAGAVADDDAGILAGQWKEYLVFSMNDMLQGTRPTLPKMLSKLQALKAEEIEALAHFYAAQR